jgi:hypothetical protein
MNIQTFYSVVLIGKSINKTLKKKLRLTYVRIFPGHVLFYFGGGGGGGGFFILKKCAPFLALWLSPKFFFSVVLTYVIARSYRRSRFGFRPYFTQFQRNRTLARTPQFRSFVSKCQQYSSDHVVRRLVRASLFFIAFLQ